MTLKGYLELHVSKCVPCWQYLHSISWYLEPSFLNLYSCCQYKQQKHVLFSLKGQNSRIGNLFNSYSKQTGATVSWEQLLTAAVRSALIAEQLTAPGLCLEFSATQYIDITIMSHHCVRHFINVLNLNLRNFCHQLKLHFFLFLKVLGVSEGDCF